MRFLKKLSSLLSSLRSNFLKFNGYHRTFALLNYEFGHEVIIAHRKSGGELTPASATVSNFWPKNTKFICNSHGSYSSSHHTDDWIMQIRLVPVKYSKCAAMQEMFHLQPGPTGKSHPELCMVRRTMKQGSDGNNSPNHWMKTMPTTSEPKTIWRGIHHRRKRVNWL